MAYVRPAKHFVLSVVVTVISSGAMAANVHAFPQVAPSFNFKQTNPLERDFCDSSSLPAWAPAESAAEESAYGVETTYRSAIESSRILEANRFQEYFSPPEHRCQSATRPYK